MGYKEDTVILESNKYSELIAQHSALFNEPKWLTEKRLSAWEASQSELLPDRVVHLWRYSDPECFEVGNREISLEKIKPLLSISKDGLNKGIVLLELSEAFSHKEYGKLIKEKFGQLTSSCPRKIKCINEATWSNGYFLYVPPGVKIEEPIVTKLFSRLSNKYQTIRILIILGEEANISLVDEFGSSNESNNLLTNVVVETFLARGAKLNYLNLQTHDKKNTQHLFHRAILDSHSELTNLIVGLGGKVSKADLGAILNGHGASITTYGIVLGDGIQKFDHHTTLEHLFPFTRSFLNFRVALKDKARSAYTGNLKIAHEAVKSDAYQENRNLLLSSDARADSIPELEILTNDVIRCSHGVTVGQVDKDQIYYLMSRGLNQKDAERIIIEGFLEPTISRIPDESLKEDILARIKSKLEEL